MNQALFLNLAIIAVILVTLVALQNPLALFGLLLLKELPYDLLMRGDEEKADPIGFVQ